MSGITASGIWTTTVTTTQQSPLGFVLTTPTVLLPGNKNTFCASLLGTVNVT